MILHRRLSSVFFEDFCTVYFASLHYARDSLWIILLFQVELFFREERKREREKPFLFSFDEKIPSTLSGIWCWRWLLRGLFQSDTMGHGRMSYPFKTARLFLIFIHVIIFVRSSSNHLNINGDFSRSLAHRCDISKSKYWNFRYATFSWSDGIPPKYRKYVIKEEIWFDFLRWIRCDYQQESNDIRWDDLCDFPHSWYSSSISRIFRLFKCHHTNSRSSPLCSLVIFLSIHNWFFSWILVFGHHGNRFEFSNNDHHILRCSPNVNQKTNSIKITSIDSQSIPRTIGEKSSIIIDSLGLDYVSCKSIDILEGLIDEIF